jgi:rare lipoprotein A (peptidoglycan hydrolase)
MCLMRKIALALAALSIAAASPAGAQGFKDRWWSPIPKAEAAEKPADKTTPGTQGKQKNRPPSQTSGLDASQTDANSPQHSLHSPKAGGVLIGKASFYAYRGGRTASGTLYDRNGLTAASRTLPFGTRLRVTDLKTNKTVDVTVTDRGPASRRLILDLSLGAAQQLGIGDRGIVQVRAEIIS